MKTRRPISNESFTANPTADESTPPTSIASTAIALLTILTGCALSVWVLSAGYNAGELPWRPIVPFGLLEIVVVQVAAALPLAWFTSTWIVGRSRCGTSISHGFNRKIACWVLAGSALAAAALWFGQDISRMCESISPTGRMLARPALSLLLTIPWCAAAHSCWFPETNSAVLPFAKVSLAALWLMVAVALPAAYLHSRLGELTNQAETWVTKQRTWRAWQLTAALVDLGSQQPLFNHSPALVAESLERQLNELLQTVSVPLAANATNEARLQRALQLASLDEFASAQQALADLPHREPAAALLLAAIQQEQNRWSASNESCRSAIELVENSHGDADQAAAMRWQAYDAMYANFHQLGKFSDAEATLQKALANVPQCAGQIHQRLAENYRMTGQQSEAMNHLLAARQSTGGNSAQINHSIDQLRAESAGCILFYTPPTSSFPGNAASH